MFKQYVSNLRNEFSGYNGKKLSQDIILPFFGGVPATAAIARTSVVIKSGTQIRLTGIFHAVGLLASNIIMTKQK